MLTSSFKLFLESAEVTVAAVDVGSAIDVPCPPLATSSSIFVGPFVFTAGLEDGYPAARDDSMTRYRADVPACIILIVEPFLQYNNLFSYLIQLLQPRMVEAHSCAM
jgi:hypothetical protein